MIVKPRRPIDDSSFYLESDEDYILNNRDLCVAFLDSLITPTGRLVEWPPKIEIQNIAPPRTALGDQIREEASKLRSKRLGRFTTNAIAGDRLTRGVK